MNTRLNLLPRRSSLQPGESLLSLLVRLEKLNYYEPGMIGRLCRQAAGGSKESANPARSRQAHTFVQLAVLTGLDPAQLFAASGHGFAPALNIGNNEGYITLPGGQVRPLLNQRDRSRRLVNRAQFCPLCLKTATYHRQVWSLNLTMLCLEHQCVLVHQCPGCGSEVTVAEVVSGQCQACQFDLSKAPVTSVASDAPEMTSQRIIQRWLTTALALMSPPGDAAPDAALHKHVENNPPHWELLGKGQVMQVLNLPEGAITRLTGLGRLRHARVPVGETRLLLFRRDKILEIAREWEKGLSLGDVRCWLGLTEEVVVGLVETGALRLEQGAPHSRNDWLFDRQSIVEFVKTIADKLKLTKELVGSQLSLAAASHELWSTPLNSTDLLNMVAEGRLQGYHQGAWRDNLITLHFAQADIDSLVKAIVAGHNWISDKQLTRRLGMSDMAFLSLRKQNSLRVWFDLETVAYYDRTFYFEPQAIKQFCANCLTSAQAAEMLGISKTALMRKYVLAGRLYTMANPRRDGSRRYLFWRKDVEWWC